MVPGRPLTSTDAPGHRHVVAVVALQPFVVVTRSGGAAVLVELRCAHLAAPASIHHRADTRGAKLRPLGALAQCRAASRHLNNGNHSINQSIVHTVIN